MASMAIVIGPVSDLDEEAADPEGDELRRRAARGQGAVGLDQPLALDDRRQVGVVGGVEEASSGPPPAPVTTSSCGKLSTPSDERDRDRAEQHGPPEVGPDQDRPSPQAVDPRARDEPEDQRAPRSSVRSTATSNAPAPSTRIATSGSAIRVMSDPKTEIVAADQTRTNAAFARAGNRKGCARSMEHSHREDLVEGGCVTLDRPRCVRTRAPPGHGLQHGGPAGPSPCTES